MFTSINIYMVRNGWTISIGEDRAVVATKHYVARGVDELLTIVMEHAKEMEYARAIEEGDIPREAAEIAKAGDSWEPELSEPESGGALSERS